VLRDPADPAAEALLGIADTLAVRRRSLAGLSLSIDTTRRG
jgi:ATP-binding protein involved in chromosome partitioning